jgi:hypothetical protein
MMLGWTIMMSGSAMLGFSDFVTRNYQKTTRWGGDVLLVAAILQTVGAMVIATSDIDVDKFAKRHPIGVVFFSLLWIVVYTGFNAFTPPIAATSQARWIAVLPFVYLLLRFRTVLHLQNKDYPRCSDLFAYGLAFDLGSNGVFLFLNAIVDTGRIRIWPFNLVGSLFFLCGLSLFSTYRFLRTAHCRRIALSITLYGYLLGWGVCNLAWTIVNAFAFNHGYHGYRNAPVPPRDYGFSAVHLAFPLAYFAFRTLIYRTLGKRWLEQRRDAIEFRLTPALETRGNLAEVETAITAKVDLNAFVFFTEEDELTLLHLAVLNEHYDSVQRLLLKTGEVQANKPSGSKGRTALFLAAELGRLHAVVLLLEHSADVNTLADDDQSPLIVATANGHTKVAALLREHGANEEHKWMGLRGNCHVYSSRMCLLAVGALFNTCLLLSYLLSYSR